MSNENNGNQKKSLSSTLKYFFGVGDAGFVLMSNIETFYFMTFLTDLAGFSAVISGMINSVFTTVDACLSWLYGGEERGPYHQLGGYPYFTQTDPRWGGAYPDLDVLLFQLDSQLAENRGEPDLVLWGDCGVGNFFISREALKKRDFSRGGLSLGLLLTPAEGGRR